MSIGVTILKPFIVTPASMVGSSIPEDDYPTYAAGTTYAEDDRVVYDHSIYQSLQAENTGKTPTDYATWWVRVGPVNRWRAFDRSHTTATVVSGGSMWFEIKPGQVISSFAMLAMKGISSCRLVMTDPAFGVVYDKTTEFPRLQARSSWHSWFFGKRIEKTEFRAMDLPSYPNATLRIELEGLDVLSVGVILLGDQFNFGRGTQQGMSLSMRDYSRKETDQWGEVILQQRAFSRLRSIKVLIDNDEIADVEQTLNDIRATPALWIVSNQNEALNVYGWYSSFDILLQYSRYAECSIDIEGLS